MLYGKNDIKIDWQNEIVLSVIRPSSKKSVSRKRNHGDNVVEQADNDTEEEDDDEEYVA